MNRFEKFAKDALADVQTINGEPIRKPTEADALAFLSRRVSRGTTERLSRGRMRHPPFLQADRTSSFVATCATETGVALGQLANAAYSPRATRAISPSSTSVLCPHGGIRARPENGERIRGPVGG
jgi:hypothetical protein